MFYNNPELFIIQNYPDKILSTVGPQLYKKHKFKVSDKNNIRIINKLHKYAPFLRNFKFSISFMKENNSVHQRGDIKIHNETTSNLMNNVFLI